MRAEPRPVAILIQLAALALLALPTCQCPGAVVADAGESSDGALEGDAQVGDARTDDIQHDDIQHNDIQHNDIQHDDIQHNDIRHDDIQHDDIQHNDLTELDRQQRPDAATSHDLEQQQDMQIQDVANPGDAHLSDARVVDSGAPDPAAPNIWYLDIVAGANVGSESGNGAYLTLNGQNFGVPVGTLPPATTKVYVGGTEVAAYKYLGQGRGRPDAWQLAVQLGPDNASGAVVVTTEHGSATAAEEFVVNNGAFYFVATSGSDSSGDGTFDSPFRSVNHALKQCDAGCHVVVRGGHYRLSSEATENRVLSDAWIALSYSYALKDSNTTGTQAAPITVMGYPGEEVLVDYQDQSTLRGIETYDGEPLAWFSFANFTIDLGDSAGLAAMLGFYISPESNRLDNARLVNLTVKGGMAGCNSNGGMNTLSLQSVDGLKLYGLDIGQQSTSAQSDCASHVIYLSHHYANADIGWIYVHDNALGGRSALQIAGDGAEAYYTRNVNVRVHHSYFQNLSGGALTTGRGSYQVTVYSNIFDNCSISPNFVNDPNAAWCSVFFRGGGAAAYGDYQLYNNTFHGSTANSTAAALVQLGFSPEGGEYPNSVAIHNNIFFASSPTTAYFTINAADFDPMTRVTSGNNIYFGSSVYNNRTGSADQTLGVAPDYRLPIWEALGSSEQDPGLSDVANQDYTVHSSTSAAAHAGDCTAGRQVVDRDYLNRPLRSENCSIGANQYQ